MKYEIKQFVMRFRPGQILSSEELVVEGIDANKWIKEGLLVAINPIIKEEVKVEEIKQEEKPSLFNKLKVKKSQK